MFLTLDGALQVFSELAKLGEYILVNLDLPCSLVPHLKG